MRRPVGSDGFFREHADLPSAASLDAQPREGKSKPKKSAPAKPAKRDEKSEREAAAKYAKEERQREKQRAKAEAEAAKARKKRNAAIEKAQAALLRAEAEHEEKATRWQRIWKLPSGALKPRKSAGTNSSSAWKKTCTRQKTDAPFRCR